MRGTMKKIWFDDTAMMMTSVVTFISYNNLNSCRTPRSLLLHMMR